MKETTNLSPLAAFSYTWNKEETRSNRLSRFIFGVGSFLKSALFCGHKVELQEAVNLMINGHQNAIFVRHSELSHYNIESLDE